MALYKSSISFTGTEYLKNVESRIRNDDIIIIITQLLSPTIYLITKDQTMALRNCEWRTLGAYIF